ncbi:MAG TPA: hypothetical protein VGH28_15580 [Polyangiaceae bacterium]|jgi:tetratricopeptide (TPR) repeat protein
MHLERVLLVLVTIGCGASATPPTLTSATVASQRPDLAVYQRANELDRAGRCDDAQRAYTAYANRVIPVDARSASMALWYSTLCRKHASPDATVDAVVTDVVAGHDREAIDLAEQGIRDGDRNPWLEYNLGVALSGAGRTSDAVDAFSRAEQSFEGDRAARSAAIYGRARALQDGKRCDEAKRAYADYAALVRDSDAKAAAAALAIRCR